MKVKPNLSVVSETGQNRRKDIYLFIAPSLQIRHGNMCSFLLPVACLHFFLVHYFFREKQSNGTNSCVQCFL